LNVSDVDLLVDGAVNGPTVYITNSINQSINQSRFLKYHR